MKNFEQFLNEHEWEYKYQSPFIAIDDTILEQFGLKNDETAANAMQFIHSSLKLPEGTFPLKLAFMNKHSHMLFPNVFDLGGAIIPSSGWEMIDFDKQNVKWCHLKNDCTCAALDFHLSKRNRNYAKLDGFYFGLSALLRHMPGDMLISLMNNDAALEQMSAAFGSDEVANISTKYKGAIKLSKYNI